MGNNDALAKVLSVVGTVLVMLPLLAPVVLGLGTIGSPAGFRVDYLMPFEVYPVTLVGVALLVWASFRAHARKRVVGLSVGGMFGCIVLATIAAQVTGIASSEARLATWKYVLTASLGGLSLLAQVALTVAGSLLIRDVFAARDGDVRHAAHMRGA